MPQPALFAPIRIGRLDLANRIVVAPMCQYSAEDGCVNDWHLIHLGQLALSGAALLTIEAAAVLPEGRISHADVGLWNDQNESAIGLIVESIRRWSDTAIAIPLNHAGRRASVDVPWKGGAQFSPDQALGWETVAPSPIAFLAGQIAPHALERHELHRIRHAFAAAAMRSVRVGIDAVDIHAASGYLLHQFLSPLSNERGDEYGGSLANRMRFPLEVVDAVRNAVSTDGVVSVRISGTDWMSGGWDPEQSLIFAEALERCGCDLIQVTSGGLHPMQHMPSGPGYQVPLARAVKGVVTVPVVAEGMISACAQAEAIVATGDADMVALERALLDDPRWPWRAATELGAPLRIPEQYADAGRSGR